MDKKFKNYRELLNERLEDENFRKEYEKLGPEYDAIRAVLDARQKANLTQKQLSELSGVAQADISRLENGNSNPTLKMLQRLANSMNMDLKIEFVPRV